MGLPFDNGPGAPFSCLFDLPFPNSTVSHPHRFAHAIRNSYPHFHRNRDRFAHTLSIPGHAACVGKLCRAAIDAGHLHPSTADRAGDPGRGAGAGNRRD